MKQHFIEDIHIGDVAEMKLKLNIETVLDFARVSTDQNPLHVDSKYAGRTFFKRPIAHGALILAHISAVLGTKYPGPGTIFISQNVDFLFPAYVEDEITSIVEVTEIINKKDVKLRILAKNQEGRILVDGFAVVKPPKIPIS